MVPGRYPPMVVPRRAPGYSPPAGDEPALRAGMPAAVPVRWEPVRHREFGCPGDRFLRQERPDSGGRCRRTGTARPRPVRTAVRPLLMRCALDHVLTEGHSYLVGGDDGGIEGNEGFVGAEPARLYRHPPGLPGVVCWCRSHRSCRWRTRPRRRRRHRRETWVVRGPWGSCGSPSALGGSAVDRTDQRCRPVRDAPTVGGQPPVTQRPPTTWGPPRRRRIRTQTHAETTLGVQARLKAPARQPDPWASVTVGGHPGGVRDPQVHADRDDSTTGHARRVGGRRPAALATGPDPARRVG